MLEVVNGNIELSEPTVETDQERAERHELERIAEHERSEQNRKEARKQHDRERMEDRDRRNQG
jgi:hypothetical protein